MYLPSSLQGIPAWFSNVPDPEYQKLGDDLFNALYKDLAERKEMMKRAMELSLEDSLQVWLIDGKAFIPYAQNAVVTADLAAGVQGAQIWPYTVRFDGQEGGTFKWATQDLFGQAWNPIAGSNWAYDAGAYRGTMSGDVMFDPFTGLVWPLRIEKMDVTVKEGLAVGKTLDWVTLNFAPEIKVPGDVWMDWDAKTQTFITADQKLVIDAEKAVAALEAAKTAEIEAPAKVAEAKAALDGLAATATEEEKAAAQAAYDEAVAAQEAAPQAVIDATAASEAAAVRTSYDTKSKQTVTYPADLYETVKWHDGSKFSVADILMTFIMRFDRANKDSAIYDEQAVPIHESFMSAFKGFKIVSTDPLVIDFYSDTVLTDAELLIPALWPNYQNFGEGAWHELAIGNEAEAAGELAYSIDKSEPAKIEETSFIGGPSMEILAKHLDKAIADKLIPYAPTLGAYITADEAAARYDNYKAFYDKHKHFWLGTGQYLVDKVFMTEKTLVLRYFPDYPDASDRWSNYGEPKVAEVELDGPGSVTIGQEAVFDVYVTFKSEPYLNADVKYVKGNEPYKRD
jgi:hypothetical protein